MHTQSNPCVAPVGAQGAIGVHMPSNVQGTFNYMAPEAFDPEAFGGVTFAADAWSFACTLTEMITGVKPW